MSRTYAPGFSQRTDESMGTLVVHDPTGAYLLGTLGADGASLILGSTETVIEAGGDHDFVTTFWQSHTQLDGHTSKYI